MEAFDPAATFNDDYLWFYEPILTQERNQAEAAEIVVTLDLAPGASILDAPCGHGRIANALATAGFAVTGVDATALFLERARLDARTRGVDVDYRLGDLRDLPCVESFDAALCWFTSFGYFDDVDNRRSLDEFSRVVRPGGKLLIETLHHDGFVRGMAGRSNTTVTERGDDLLIDVTTFDSISGRMEAERTVRRDGRTRRSHHSIRLPTVPEFDEWLAAALFSKRRYSARDGEPLTSDSRRLVITALK